MPACQVMAVFHMLCEDVRFLEIALMEDFRARTTNEEITTSEDIHAHWLTTHRMKCYRRLFYFTAELLRQFNSHVCHIHRQFDAEGRGTI